MIDPALLRRLASPAEEHHGDSAPTRGDTPWSLVGLCLLVGGSGILHFVAPGAYRRIVPAPLRAYAPALVAASGFCELACAVLLTLPRTRRWGATATALLLLAVFPANIQMALDSRHAATPVAVVAWLRLPLQAPLICWALHFRRRQTPVKRAMRVFP